jgi:large subunit ribosomal protein L20
MCSFDCFGGGMFSQRIITAMRSLIPRIASGYASPILSSTLTLPIMTTITRGFANHRHKKMIKAAKGYFGRVNLYAVAKRRVDKARVYSFRDRKVRKREFRQLWIQRLNASTRMYGMPYNIFINKLNQSGVQLDRKVLADLAVTEPLSFRTVFEVVKSS